jgi:thiol:disulfide interchange protein DsbD
MRSPTLPQFRWIAILILCLFAGSWTAAAASGADEAGLSLPGSDEHMKVVPHLDSSALVPGKRAMLAVVLTFDKGWHSRSSIGEKQVATRMQAPSAGDGVTFGAPVYPPGQDKELGVNGVLNIYESGVILQVPVEVSADARPGDVTIKGAVFAQICNDNTCEPPKDFPFEFKTRVLPPGSAVTPASPEFFQAASTALAAPPPPAIKKKSEIENLWAAFGLAFLVGIVFNVVPCVLPVLPLKAIGFYETAQHNRAKSVTFGLAFSLGVIAAFATLGLFVVVLKKITWGELFSNQYFTGVLVIILVAMALNMFGVFTVNLPAGAYAFSPRHDTYFGNFLFGILTAALSTPCTFGLFVSVLTVALTQPEIVGLLLICVVGAGMASPYLVLSALPELARKFPRTGPWAELVKQFMAFLLLCVAIFFAQGWIARIMAAHLTYWIIFGVLLAGCIFLVAKSAKYAKTAKGPIVAIVIALLIAVPGFFVTRAFAVQPYTWKAYSPELLADLRAKDQIVLVDFTATWCINCHTVEATVLNSRTVQRLVQDHQVQMVKADITDTEQPAYHFWKFEVKAVGVPLTMIYPPGKREPISLPVIYSIDDLKAAIEQAAARQTAMR